MQPVYPIITDRITSHRVGPRFPEIDAFIAVECYLIVTQRITVTTFTQIDTILSIESDDVIADLIACRESTANSVQHDPVTVIGSRVNNCIA